MSSEPLDPAAPPVVPPFSPVAIPADQLFSYQRLYRPRFQDRIWKHVVLLLATLGTTTLVGATYYYSFASDFGRTAVAFDRFLLLHGLWYSLPVLMILGAHEMGHYLFCRYYNVDASLPFFIPAPLPLTGTFGAVIRIREAFPNRTVLFDIGIGGPIAGFVVLLPLLFWGMWMSQIVPAANLDGGLAFGEPLLFRAATWLVLGPVRDGQMLNAHPMVFACWFGMLATSLNLLPFGQLDGGHITYATLKRQSMPLSLLTVASAVVMCYFSTGWYAMTAIMLVMLFTMGPRHPRVLYEDAPLEPSRIALAIFALVMLILCFTPVPIQPMEILGR